METPSERANYLINQLGKAGALRQALEELGNSDNEEEKVYQNKVIEAVKDLNSTEKQNPFSSGEAMRKIHFADFIEKEVAEILTTKKIKFIHESEDRNLKLDFYLPDFDVYLEIKQFHSDRVNEQLKSKENVIVIQGRESLEFFKHVFKI